MYLATIWSHVGVLVSLIVGLGVARILDRLAELVRRRRCWRVDPLHSAWVGLVFVLHLEFWWRFTDYTDLSWTFPALGMYLVAPSLLLFAADLLLPRFEVLGSGDLREHFAEIRQPFFLVLQACLAAITLNATVLLCRPFLEPENLGRLIAIVLAVVGYRFESRRAQWTVLILGVVTLVAFLSVRGDV